MNARFKTGTGLGLMLAALLGASAANAALVQSSTSTYVTFRDCVAGATACDALSPILTGTFGGAPGSQAAGSSQTDGAFGTATADAQLTGVANAPVLSGNATSLAGKRNSSNSYGLQRYTYTGAVQTTRTFGGTLTYSQFVPLANAGFPEIASSGVFASLSLFTLADAFLDAGVTAEDNFFALNNGYAGASGYNDLGTDAFSDIASNVAGNAAMAVTVTLNPGDSVWAWAALQTPGADGAMVDSARFITGWDDTSDLVADNGVPEPGSLALVGLSMLALGMARRRRA